MTINVQIGGQSEEYVQGQLSSGQYSDASDVVRDALQLMAERDQVRAEMRQKIEAGWQSIQAGRVVDGEAFMAELDAKDNALLNGSK